MTVICTCSRPPGVDNPSGNERLLSPKDFARSLGRGSHVHRADGRDGDGYTNLQEYQAGTDPTNPSSNPGGGYTGSGYYDANGVFVGFPGGGGTSTGDGANGDDGVNDACWGTVGAHVPAPWFPVAAAILLLAVPGRRRGA